MTTRRWKAIVLPVVALISACTLEPRYQRPEPPVAQVWPLSAQPALKAGATAAPIPPWRTYFSDPALQRLIDIALKNNRDLRVAALNIEAARAQYRIQRAALLPSVNATASRSSTRSASSLTLPGEPSIARIDQVGIGVSAYELDLFGRIRSLSHAALEHYFGLEETRRSVHIALIASVADAYYAWLADQALLSVTLQTEKTDQASVDLSRKTLEYGVGTELTVRQAETALDSARANQAVYERQVAQDVDALALLIGTPVPEDLPQARLEVQSLNPVLPQGLPSDILVQRPDVLAAEHELRAANADIGAARAAFFPRIALTGSVGFESPQLAQLFKAASRTWSFVPQLTLPIFAAGANEANLDLAKTERNIQVANYEKAIQSAFREVADCLAAMQTYERQVEADEALVFSSQRNFELANLRFNNGVDSYLTTLDAQRTLYSAQQSLIGARLGRLQNLTTTYRALGGGWDGSNEDDSSPKARP